MRRRGNICGFAAIIAGGADMPGLVVYPPLLLMRRVMKSEGK